MTMLTLVLANGRGFPSGSADHRYELEATLDTAGRLDEDAWRADAVPWPVRRFRPGEPQLDGELRLDEETGWSLRFVRPGGDQGAGEITEPLVRAGTLRPGEYVSLRDASGEEFSYRIVSMG